ncbi:MAG TPA: pyridoxamine 5'-phosphate oxidase family protein [Terriglobales bacterium]|jgi:nitroimidazol reductase NimA-like FMN-containing flavoprotein (pyridoxamine 5'-phosphate oxidase superfamily)|nr:pyridoxamine 5'-phosphate oxidase family protein [Terriglobales bacterium]
MASLSDALVNELLSGRYIASFSSQNADGSIHVVAVWYCFDGGNIYVATSSRSRKARNIQLNPKVSLMIDSRDPAASRGVCIAGTARFLTGESACNWNAKVHVKYLSPAALADERVGPVFAAWDDVTVEITPTNVFAWDMREADKQAFGGAFEKNPGYLLSAER